MEWVIIKHSLDGISNYWTFFGGNKQLLNNSLGAINNY